jgi:hypothetical protein
MSTFADWLGGSRRLLWVCGAFVVAVVLVAVGTTNLLRPRMAANAPTVRAQQQFLETELASNMYDDPAKSKPVAMITSDAANSPPVGAGRADVFGDRRMIRTGAVDLVVQHPSEVAEKIRLLAETRGGFLVSSEVSGGQNATGGALTIRVPASQFEEAWAEIRKLGRRVDAEKIEAQDVTRQYVDQDASLRNLRAEEAQYLGILKQARTVKDMLEVSEKLTEVRGQIERQQAEFDALSKQVETVAIAISLRTEAEAQVFGLHWRPLYQMKLALRDGLDAVAGYSGAMTAIVFYLPAVMLWIVTIVVGAAAGWKVVRWAGRVFFAWPKRAAVENG